MKRTLWLEAYGLLHAVFNHLLTIELKIFCQGAAVSKERFFLMFLFRISKATQPSSICAAFYLPFVPYIYFPTHPDGSQI